MRRASRQNGRPTGAATAGLGGHDLQAVVEMLPQALVVYDKAWRVSICSQGLRTLLDIPARRRAGDLDLLTLLRSSRLLARAAGSADALFAQMKGDASERQGDPATERSSSFTVADGPTLNLATRQQAGGFLVTTFEDTTLDAHANSASERLVRRDALTGLGNRVLLGERLEAASEIARDGGGLAILCLDLDNFKAVNDTLGHAIGDALLRTVADRLRSAVRTDDVVVRLGGDEFAILQPGIASPGQVQPLAQRLVDLIGRSYVIEGQLVNVGVSVGIALSPVDSSEPNRLLKQADLALCCAKADGRGTFRFFEHEMEARMERRRALELDLRKAMALKQLEVHYQPQVAAATGAIHGFEALVRWRHPTRGMVSPAEFIPVAEELGLIAPLGEWVLRQACNEAARWPEHVSIAVNLSPLQFKSKGLLRTVSSALASSGLPASRLELEITEGVLLSNDEGNLSALHRLRAMGVRLAMDDFGTGYSSLSYLLSFPFDKIKIDRAFIRDLGSKRDGTAVIRAVASLGASLDMPITAEGVETEEQLSRIRAEGCQSVQGFLFGKPMPAFEVLRLLAKDHRQAA